eukprot:TRINITY_DN14772_c0_g1_i3.p2 TRINITY_DN14772_c0_g1~~TRINITY_DN14772_c0_g1_i3.p2  ORF type:complete len:147 (+),score=35.31 TRINITY_DN14772_c0_g1_i3:154-594(+)
MDVKGMFGSLIGMWEAAFPSGKPIDEAKNGSSEASIPTESDIAQKSKDLEDSLETDLKIIAKERQDTMKRLDKEFERKMLRLDMELAEAMEEMHWRTSAEVNKRLDKHKQDMAALQGGLTEEKRPTPPTFGFLSCLAPEVIPSDPL